MVVQPLASRRVGSVDVEPSPCYSSETPAADGLFPCGATSLTGPSGIFSQSSQAALGDSAVVTNTLTTTEMVFNLRIATTATAASAAIKTISAVHFKAEQGLCDGSFMLDVWGRIPGTFYSASVGIGEMSKPFPDLLEIQLR